VIQEKTMHKSWRFLLAAVLTVMLAVTVAPWGVNAQPGQKKEASLYNRLGKKAGITKVVNDFVGNVGADTRINQYFAHTDLNHLKMELVNQICQAAGGPCKYTGKSMKAAHEGMGVSTADFNALVGDLVKALDSNKVGENEKNTLLGVLGPMKSDIVEKP
jgi:hemoglobin